MDPAQTLTQEERHLLVLRQAYLQAFSAEERAVAGHFFAEALKRMKEEEAAEEAISPDRFLAQAKEIAQATLQDPLASEVLKAGAARFLQMAEATPLLAQAGAYWSLGWATLPKERKEKLRSFAKDLHPSLEDIRRAMAALGPLLASSLETPAPAPRPTFRITPTPEQEAALEAFLSGQDLKLVAVAGSGKTTTLQLMAEAAPKRRLLYVAFNRSIMEEGIRRFPKNTKVLTLHALARRYTVAGNGAYQRKLNARNGKVSPRDILEALDLERDKYAVAYAVRDTLDAFLRSGSEVPHPAHVPPSYRDALARGDKLPSVDYIVKAAKLVWKLMQDPNNPFPLSFDGFVKMWAQAGARIGGYDAVLVDEAQDLSPVFLQVLEEHRGVLQRMYVGDPRQQIYAWRGAVNAMAKLEVPERPLTWSFRFSEELARGVRALMEWLDAPLSLQGKAPWETEVAPYFPDTLPFTVLCRSNVGAVEAIAALLLGEEREVPHLPEAKVFLVGGTRELTWLLEDANALQKGLERGEPHPELALVESWDELSALAEEFNYPWARMLLRLGEKYNLQALSTFLKAAQAESEEEAQVVVSTLHKAKGREWDRVVLWNDFVSVWDPAVRDLYRAQGLTDALLEEENILYVALTRSRRFLGLPELPELLGILEGGSSPKPQALPELPHASNEVDRLVEALAGAVEAVLAEAIKRAVADLRGALRQAVEKALAERPPHSSPHR